MKKRRVKVDFCSLVFHAVMVFASAMLISTAAAAFKNLGEGMEVPSFTLKDLGGQEVSSDGIKGKKAAVIVFFATWSERSLVQLKDLEEVRSALKEQGLEIIAINVDHEGMDAGEIETVRGKVAELGVTYPVLVDTDLGVYRRFGVVAVPSSAVVKSGGIVVATVNGYPSLASNEIKERVEVLLGVKEDASASTAAETGYRPERSSLLNYNLARRLYDSGMHAKAERKLQIAIKSDDKFVKPKVLLGDIYLAKAAKKKAYLLKAKGMYETALEVSPGDEAASTGLARVFVREGAVDDAEKLVDSVLEKNPAYTTALIVKGLILAKRGNEKETDRYVMEAVGLARMDPEVLALAGTVYQESGNLNKAALFYRKAGEKLGY
ncbi:MAG: redoxin domain-containing protein [Deltaproteobacteria bacterium]|nr:redoxin domain-containing protein [Deltaproteobacteria bacterium]NIS77383.1 redoxin domain-containing protein [Deltaproteobacteria bacterium]